MAFILIIATGSAALALAWILWLWRDRKSQLAKWRRAVAYVGFLAVTAQVLIFVGFWNGAGHSDALFARWSRWVFLSFFVALPCSVAGKGPSRLCLVLASILLFTICFFMVLSA